MIGRLLCKLGSHDWIPALLMFGSDTFIQGRRCRRCEMEQW